MVVVPEDVYVNSRSPFGVAATFSTPTASDNVSTDLLFYCTSFPIAELVSGNVFPVGTTTITCTAEDEAGNVGQAKFNVTVTLRCPWKFNRHGACSGIIFFSKRVVL